MQNKKRLKIKKIDSIKDFKMDKDTQSQTKTITSLVYRIFTLFIRAIIVVFIAGILLIAMIIGFVSGTMLSFIFTFLYFWVMRWIYRKFVKSRIQGKIKRVAIIFGMFILYCTEPIITHIYAYYKFAYSAPTQNDLIDWRHIKPKLGSVTFSIDGKEVEQNKYSDDERFDIRDIIVRDGEFVNVTREVSRNWKLNYFLFFTMSKNENGDNFPLFTKELGRFNVGKIDIEKELNSLNIDINNTKGENNE